MFRLAPALALVALVLAGPLEPAAAGAAAPDWGALADVEVVHVVTRDENGEPRETKIWLLVLEDEGYIRTSGTSTWGDNVVRDPGLVLRIEEREYPLRAEFVEDEALRARVLAGLRQKYGWSDALIEPFRRGRARIMRLLPR